MRIMGVLLGFIVLGTAGGREADGAARTEGQVVVLEPLKVKGKPIISFGLNLRIYMDPDTRKVDRILITGVAEKTDAEEAGLRAGDEVVKFNDVPVKDYEARVAADTPLGRLLLNRPPGEKLKLEVITHRTETHVLRALLPAPPNE